MVEMKKLVKKLRELSLLLVVLLIINGCASSYEPNELSFIQIIGIDEGQENLLEVSFLIAIPQNLAGENGGGGEGAFLVTVSAPTIFLAMKLANTFVGRRLSLTHAKGVIFSDELAKKGLITEILPSLLQFRETRGTAFVGITEGRADKLLEKFVPLLEASPSRYMELLTENYAFTSFTSSTHIQDVYNDLKVLGTDSVVTLLNLSPEKLPEGQEQGEYRVGGSYKAGELPKKGGMELEALGGAVLRDGKMVATLTGIETMFYNLIRGKYKTSFFALPAHHREDAIINMEVSYARKPQVDIKLTEQGVIIDLLLRLEGNILGGGTTIDYALRENRVSLEEEVARRIKEEVDKLIEKSQKLGSDFLGFGLYARKLAKTVDEWNNLDWDSLYENAQVNVTVDFKVRRTSTLFRHAPITTDLVGKEKSKWCCGLLFGL